MLLRCSFLAEIRVVKIEIMFPSSPLYLPSLLLRLEDGSEFPLFSIPFATTIAIAKILFGRRIISDVRESFEEVLIDMSDVRDVLRKKVKKVVIDRLDANNRFYATVIVDENGTEKRLIMVPSSAILLALMADADIFIDSLLLGIVRRKEREEEEETEEEEKKGPREFYI